jgi:hypothetical protein
VWSITPATVPTGPGTALAPAVAVYNGQDYFAWTTPSGNIQYQIYNEATSSWLPAAGTVMIGTTPATTLAAPALTAGSVGPFLAWTTPSGDMYYANGSVSPWSGSPVPLLTGYTTATAPALTVTGSSGGCETTYQLFLAFTNNTNDAVWLDFVTSWTTYLKPPCTF